MISISRMKKINNFRVRFSLVLVACFLLFNTYSQDNKDLTQAEELYASKHYFEASNFYRTVILDQRIDPSNNPDVYRHGIESFVKTNNYHNALDAFDQFSASDKYTFEDAHNHVLILLYVGDLVHAKNILSKSVVTASTDPKKERLETYMDQFNLSSLERGEGYAFDYDFYNAFYKGFAVEYIQKAPKILKDKKIIKESPWLDISDFYGPHFTFNQEKNVYEKNKKLKIKKHNGAAYYDSIGGVWFYSRLTNPKQDPLSAGLYWYDVKTKKETGFAYNRVDHYLGHPSLSESREVLWFTSNREGGFGGLDIWYCVKDQMGWGEPINAGDVINTDKDEMFPYEENGYLYFASNGHTILGGLDLYHVSLEGVDAKSVLEINTPIFPKKEDGVVSTDVNFNYEPSLAASNKQEFVTNQNQYLFDYLDYEKTGKFIKKYTLKRGKPDEIVLNEKIELFSTLKDKETGEAIATSQIEIIDVETSDTVVVATDSTGKIQANLERDKEYQISSGKEGYDPVMATLKTDEKVNEIVEKLEIRKTPDAPMVRLENILYNFNQFNLSKVGIAELDTLVLFLKENKDVTVEISSHTDCRGSDAYNLNLSAQRSKSCYNYLISQGVKKEKLVMKNYGESKLLNQCKDGVECPEELHQINRRTEFVLQFPK